MSEQTYEEVKESVLAHMQNLFHELEADMAMSHQEKYTLLEDMFENASDADELRVAFEQWYADHAEDLDLEHSVDDLWDQALGGEINYDNYKSDDEGTTDFNDDVPVVEEDEDDEDEKY